MKIRNKAAIYTAAWLLSSGTALASPSEYGALHVEGTRLVSSGGEAVSLRGISTHGLAWFPDYVNEACFEQLHKEWNVDVIRLAMYTAEYGGYCTGGDQEYLKQLVCDGVEYAAAQDMYAIIDWHILSDSNPNLYLEEAKQFFSEMSERFADADHVLYEICNEPNGNTTWQEIKSYAEEIIRVIRSNDEDGIILVGTPNWSQFVDQAAADPIDGYENIMYTLHFYAATHKEDLRSRMTAAVEAGLPVFVSEYGICDASGSGAIDEEQADQWVEVMNQYGISYVAWNLSNKDETSAILKSTCAKTSGFEANDLSPSGQWLYQMLTGKETDEESNGNADAENGSAGDVDVKQEGTDDETDCDEAPVSSENPGEMTLAGQGLNLHLFVVNSWEAEGKNVYQYNLTLENTSDSDYTEWEVDVPFQEEFELTDGWNGNYTAQGKVLHISSREYNGNLPAGGTVTDIGFIVRGGEGIVE